MDLITNNEEDKEVRIWDAPLLAAEMILRADIVTEEEETYDNVMEENKKLLA
jgi:uncharacterized protein (DUF488 family)